jgi:hypothetical protein
MRALEERTGRESVERLAIKRESEREEGGEAEEAETERSQSI